MKKLYYLKLFVDYYPKIYLWRFVDVIVTRKNSEEKYFKANL